MARVRKQKKSNRGKRVCGRVGCGREIQPGEEYYSWNFRYGGKQVRCLDHTPKPSELTQSKLSEVYAAIEEAEPDLNGNPDLEEVKAVVERVAEVVREVAQEYEEAAEHFGQSGENQDRAEELNAWADELENWEPDTPDEEEFVEEDYDQEAKDRSDEEDMSYSDAMQVLRDEWEAEHEPVLEELAEKASEEVQDLLSQCPL